MGHLNPFLDSGEYSKKNLSFRLLKNAKLFPRPRAEKKGPAANIRRGGSRTALTPASQSEYFLLTAAKRGIGIHETLSA